MQNVIIFERSCDPEDAGSTRTGVLDLNHDGTPEISHSQLMDSLAGGSTTCVEIGPTSNSSATWDQLDGFTNHVINLSGQVLYSYQDLNNLIDNLKESPTSGTVRQALAAIGENRVNRKNVNDYQRAVGDILMALSESDEVDIFVRNDFKAFKEAHETLTRLTEAGSSVLVASGNVAGQVSSESHFNLYSLIPGVEVVGGLTRAGQSSSIENSLRTMYIPDATRYRLQHIKGRAALVPWFDRRATPIFLPEGDYRKYDGQDFDFRGSSISTARASVLEKSR